MANFNKYFWDERNKEVRSIDDIMMNPAQFESEKVIKESRYGDILKIYDSLKCHTKFVFFDS